MKLKFTAPKIERAVRKIYKTLQQADPRSFVKDPVLIFKDGLLHYTTISEPKVKCTYYALELFGEYVTGQFPEGPIRITPKGSILTGDGRRIFTSMKDFARKQ